MVAVIACAVETGRAEISKQDIIAVNPPLLQKMLTLRSRNDGISVSCRSQYILRFCEIYEVSYFFKNNLDDANT